MALLNVKLNQDEILQLLSKDKDAAFAKLLQDSLNCILKAESTEQLKAEPYERTDLDSTKTTTFCFVSQYNKSFVISVARVFQLILLIFSFMPSFAFRGYLMTKI